VTEAAVTSLCIVTDLVTSSVVFGSTLVNICKSVTHARLDANLDLNDIEIYEQLELLLYRTRKSAMFRC